MAKRPTDVVGFFIEPDRSSDYTGEVVHPVTGEVYTPPSMTKQEFVAECDINNIIKEYLVTGQVQHITARAAQGAFLDLPSSMDLQQSLHIQQAAVAAFDQLPSRVRERFGNDAVKFLEFFENPDNREEAQRLGLLEEAAPPPPPLEVIVRAPSEGNGTDAPPVVPPVPPKA